MKQLAKLSLIFVLRLSARLTRRVHDRRTAILHRRSDILVLGDSLSEGFGLKSQPGLARADNLQKTARRRFEFRNHERQPQWRHHRGRIGAASSLISKRKIDIFILELGINDAFRGVPIDEIRNNLQEIIDQVKARNPNVRVIIAGMQVPTYAADDYVSAFGQIYADLAAKNNAALVPYLLEGVAGDPSLNLPDHIHPNAAGQKILAENVWRVLEPIAREVAKL